MAQVIFNNRIDMVTTAATPSVDGYTIGYDIDGIIKQKDSLGVITPLFSSTSQNLTQTLNIENDSGIYSIMMGTGTSIYSSNSTGRIKLDHSGSVFIYATSSATGTSSMHFSNTSIGIFSSVQDDYGSLSISGNTYSVEIGSATNSMTVKQTNNGLWIDDKDIDAASEETIRILEIGSSYDGDTVDNKAYVHINSKNANTLTGVKNSAIIGGTGLTSSASNTVYLGNSVNINNEYTLPSTDGSADQYLKTDGSGSVIWDDMVATTPPLHEVLAVGNNTQTQNIIMGTGTFIKSANGYGSIYFDSGSVSGKILISTDGVTKTKSFVEMDNSSLVISATSGTITTGNLKGLQYSADYSATFENNSLVTKQYVVSLLGNVFVSEKTAYVDPANGSDSTGLVNRLDKPFSTIAKAISGLTSSYSFISTNTGLVHLKKGIYTEFVYLYDNINFYCEPDVVFSQNGFTDSNGAVNSSIFGFANFVGTDPNLVPLDVTKASNISFNFSKIDNQSVAFKVTNTTGTSNVKIKGDSIICKSGYGKAILIGYNNGTYDVSSNVNISVVEKISSAYDTISISDKFIGTLEVNTPLIECDSDFNTNGSQNDQQHALIVRSASASVRINADLFESSSANVGGINSTVYINAGTVSIFGNISGGECPGVYLGDSKPSNVSIKGDVISKKEAIINESNNTKFMVSDSLIKTHGLGTSTYSIHINSGSMSSTYLYNARIYNSLENSGMIAMSSTGSRVGIYNSIGYGAGTASGEFIHCVGAVSVGMHNVRSNKDNSDDVEDLFTPSGFIYDKNLYLGDF
jgi:hypothetical protein